MKIVEFVVLVRCMVPEVGDDRLRLRLDRG